MVLRGTKDNLITLNEIILFKENFPQPTLTTWIVLEVELVKAMKGALISVNIQEINVKIISVKRRRKCSFLQCNSGSSEVIIDL